MMATVGRQEVETQAPRPTFKRGCKFVGTMYPAPIDDEDDFLPGRAEGGHELVEILTELRGVKVGHELIKDFGGAVLHRTHQGEQDPVFEAVPRMILLPRLAFARFGVVDLAARQRTEREPVAGRLMPPADPREGKAPQHGFICVQ